MCEFVLRLLLGVSVCFFVFANGTKMQSKNYHKCLFSKTKTSLKPCC